MANELIKKIRRQTCRLKKFRNYLAKQDDLVTGFDNADLVKQLSTVLQYFSCPRQHHDSLDVISFIANYSITLAEERRKKRVKHPIIRKICIVLMKLSHSMDILREENVMSSNAIQRNNMLTSTLF